MIGYWFSIISWVVAYAGVSLGRLDPLEPFSSRIFFVKSFSSGIKFSLTTLWLIISGLPPFHTFLRHNTLLLNGLLHVSLRELGMYSIALLHFYISHSGCSQESMKIAYDRNLAKPDTTTVVDWRSMGVTGVTSRLSPKMIEKNYALFSSRMFFALSIFKLKSDFKHKSILSKFQYFHKHVYVYFSVWSSVKVAVSHCKIY